MNTALFFQATKSIIPFSKGVLLLVLVHGMNFVFAQQMDSTATQQAVGRFSTGASVTNNGVSLIPSFSLGKPAAIFDLSLGKKRLSFEPQFRFALTGKPWSFLFWWRYKLLKVNKFTFNVGAHPAIVFRDRTYIVNGEPVNVTIEQQNIAAEFVPNYALSKNVSVGAYYLVSHGFDKGGTRSINFFALRSNFSRISLSKQLYLSIIPQVFYLRVDGKGGFYANSTVVLGKNKFPLNLSSILSKTIKTDLTGAKDFIWNISLNYSFNKNYIGI